MCIWEFGIALRRWGLFAGDKMQITRVDGLLDHEAAGLSGLGA